MLDGRVVRGEMRATIGGAGWVVVWWQNVLDGGLEMAVVAKLQPRLAQAQTQLPQVAVTAT